MQGNILIIAGSDSGGGAGIQADIKTVMALGGYASTAITALTAQNTTEVAGILEVPEEFVALQIETVLRDITIDAIKTGMLYHPSIIESVSESLDKFAPDTPFIVDPVMIAKGGEQLLEDDAIDTLKQTLMPRATLVTPNIPEAESLVGFAIKRTEDMIDAGHKMLEMGMQAVLVKGGHLEEEIVTDVLVTKKGIHMFEGPRIVSENTHGTGCTLASAIATYIAHELSLSDAIKSAKHYVSKTIETAPESIGSGHGPLNHLVKD